MAVCALLGWEMGGRLWLAALWVGLAAVVMAVLPSARPVGVLERGWGVVVAATFGIVCLVSSRETRFFPRALTALTMSVALAGFLAVITPGASTVVSRAVRQDVRSRPNDALLWVRGRQGSAEWQALTGTGAGGASFEAAERTIEDMLSALPEDAVPVFPALLALESLASLAIAWAIYHRISRTRLGERLGGLRDFRFNDQLVWGLIAGAVFVLLPSLDAWRTVGVNMLVFFGALYAVRGLAVLLWFLRRVEASAPAVAALAIVACLLSAPAAVALGFLGLGDSWLDWRARGSAAPRPAP